MLFVLAVLAAAPECKGPAWAPTPLPGYQISSCRRRAWAQLHVNLVSGDKVLEGRLEEVEYELKDEAKNATNDAARKYFTAAAKKAQATLMSDPEGGYTAVLE